MKTKTNIFDYTTVLKTLTFFAFLVLINNITYFVAPFSCAILSVVFANANSPYFFAVIYPLSFFVLGETELALISIFSSAFFIIIKLIYNSFKRKIRYECALFTALALTLYVILGTKNDAVLESRILNVIISIALTFIFYLSYNAIIKKGFKFKFSKEEYLAISISITVIGLGISNLISPLVFKGISIFFMLFCCYLFKPSLSVMFSGVLGVSFSIYYNELDYVSIFIIYSLIINSSITFSRYLSLIFVSLFDFVFLMVLKYYGDNFLFSVLPTFIGAFSFGIIPKEPLCKLKNKLFTFREKQLYRASINQNRLMISNKLYELSSVFSEMEVAFSAFSSNALNEQTAKEKALKDLTKSVCENCPNSHRCKKDQKVSLDLKKMIDIGFAKGRLSLIDMPSDTFEYCIKPNDIIFGLNKMLNGYRVATVEQQNVNNGRLLISAQAKGVSEILKSLALETGQTLKYQSKIEREILDFLLKKGYVVSEVLVYGDDDNASISMVLIDKNIDFSLLNQCVSEVLNKKMAICDKVNLVGDKIYVLLKPTTIYDAVFGLSLTTKDGSSVSGDTHSVIRINENKFMIALSDGMGSGENARKISSVSLSLLESFYKAGMKSQVILNTVNKLLSINAEDSFTALDVCVIDLNTCNVDFIKYGSPYGFIVNNSGVKIVEGNSLPLGILDELKPCVFNTKLNDGDIALLITDGISDAFGSASDVIEFLRKAPYKNPQALTDDILKKAIEKNNGKKFDDMTALAVRIYKKTR